MTDAPALTCLSWNIHRGRGNDGRVDPGRTLDVLEAEVWRPGTDILVLQEADEEWPPHRGVLDLDRIRTATGLSHVHDAPGTRWGPESHGFLGVIVFLEPSIRVEDIVLVDLPGHCHRGAVVVDAVRDGHPFRLDRHAPVADAGAARRAASHGRDSTSSGAIRDPRSCAAISTNGVRGGGLALSRPVLGAALRRSVDGDLPGQPTAPAARPHPDDGAGTCRRGPRASTDRGSAWRRITGRSLARVVLTAS